MLSEYLCVDYENSIHRKRNRNTKSVNQKLQKDEDNMRSLQLLFPVAALPTLAANEATAQDGRIQILKGLATFFEQWYEVAM